MKERVILHCDINHCFAQIEEMVHPQLRNYPMAVGGHEESRHGIILAKNDLAKKYHVKTAETLREATAKCHNLLIIHPHYELYIDITSRVKAIYHEYSDQVESFGIDEAWIDVSASAKLFGSGLAIAKEIQTRILDELGLSVSIGVSYNKIFAKFGSDLIKPLGLVEITKDNFKEVVWNNDVGDLLYVGRATKRKLKEYGIHTIKDLALTSIDFLKDHLGKMGEVLYRFAWGYDTSEVMLEKVISPVKSIGNGVTTPKDINNIQDAKLVFYVLCESVAARLRAQGLCGKVVSIGLRDTNLAYFTRQIKINQPLDSAKEIIKYVMYLLKQNYHFEVPLRSINVSISKLSPKGSSVQLSLFEDECSKLKNRDLEIVMETIRNKYGFNKVKRCITLLDEELTNFNPQEEHTIHPVGYF